MKKTILILIFVLIFTFNGCSENAEMNLSVFIDYYNTLSVNEIDFTDFSGVTADNGNMEYSLSVKDNDNIILVKLIEENDEIKECRVILSKLNNKLEKVEITEKYNDLFFSTVENVGCSFVRSTDDVLLNIFESITADPDVSEKTDKYKDYNFIYISNDICRELIIRNKWFFEEESTEKPENINSFLNTAPIRTETAPHR